MQDGSWLLCHFRYPCTQWKCKSLIKRGKRENHVGKSPPPKREMKEDAWMDGVIKTPHYNIHPIYTIEKDERKRDRIGSPRKRRMSNNNCSDEEVDPWMQNGVPPLRKKQCPRYRWDTSAMHGKNLSQRNVCPCNWWRTFLQLLIISNQTHFNL